MLNSNLSKLDKVKEVNKSNSKKGYNLGVNSVYLLMLV
jgi:hypothetical protein